MPRIKHTLPRPKLNYFWLLGRGTSSLQHLELSTSENKETSAEENSFIGRNVFDTSPDDRNALGTKYENGHIMVMCENEKYSCNSVQSCINCDLCGKHFKSESRLRDHHFVCIKDQVKYTYCEKPFSENSVSEMYMSRPLYLNKSPGKLHSNLTSETSLHLTGKSYSFIDENRVRVKTGGCGGPVAADDVLLSENTTDQNLLDHNINQGIDIQNSNMNAIGDSNAQKPMGDTSPVIDPSVSGLSDKCLEVQDVSRDRSPKVDLFSNPDAHHPSHSNDGPYCFQESNKRFSESRNACFERMKHDRENKEILLKQKNDFESIMKTSNIQNTEIGNACYSNDDQSFSDNSSVAKDFACDICGQKFSSLSNLNTHFDSHKNLGLYNCTECDKQFSRLDIFKRHVRFHMRKKLDNPKLYTCKICLKSFGWQARLKVHLRIHTNAREFRCELCGKGFNQKSTLRSHMVTHSDEKPYECSVCNMKFAMKSPLDRHLQRHSSDKPHECDVCFHRFALRVDLKKHYKKHTGERPYECHICSKKFRVRASLKAHVAAHTGNQPHKCDICQKGFFHKYALTAHRQNHTKSKIFTCNICDKSYPSNSGLKNHLQGHTGEKPFECSYCQKAFANRAGHDRHILIHTGTKPYECNICKMFFSQKTSLQRHQVVHTKEKPYSCDMCEKRFTQKSYLSIHKRKHSKDKF